MYAKETLVEIEKIEKRIHVKKDRIEKLKRLAKLANNKDLISDYDEIIKQAEDSIFGILDSKEILDSSKEQVVLRSAARVRLMAKGLKSSLCESEKQIKMLNDAIEDENIAIKNLKSQNRKPGGIV